MVYPQDIIFGITLIHIVRKYNNYSCAVAIDFAIKGHGILIILECVFNRLDV